MKEPHQELSCPWFDIDNRFISRNCPYFKVTDKNKSITSAFTLSRTQLPHIYLQCSYAHHPPFSNWIRRRVSGPWIFHKECIIAPSWLSLQTLFLIRATCLLQQRQQHTHACSSGAWGHGTIIATGNEGICEEPRIDLGNSKTCKINKFAKSL